jgi:hypothetical protein
LVRGISLNKITEQYFSILKDYFADLQKWNSKRGYSGPESVEGIAELYNPESMKGTMETLSQELKKLDWETQSSVNEKVGGLRTAYLGQGYIHMNYPETTFNFMKKTALYMDEIIVNDPLLSELLTWQKRGTGETLSFNLVAQYALQLLSIEDLFISDTDQPICCLAPSSVVSLENRGIREKTEKFIEDCVVPSYASGLFNKNFESKEDLENYLGTFKSFGDFILNIRKSELKFTNPTGTPVKETDYLRVRQYYEEKYNIILPDSTSLFLLIRGRFSMAAYDLAVNARVASNFVTDFKGVWDSLLWLVKNDNKLINEYCKKNPISKESIIVGALQQFKWLGEVPLGKIKEMRERGELQEIRAILGQNISELQNVSDEEFFEVGKQVKYNLEEALKKHGTQVKDLNEKYKKRYDIDLASLIVSGSFGIVSALFPPLVLTATLIGGGSLLDILKTYANQSEQLQALQKKPIAMLFDAYNKDKIRN